MIRDDTATHTRIWISAEDVIDFFVWSPIPFTDAQKQALDDYRGNKITPEECVKRLGHEKMMGWMIREKSHVAQHDNSHIQDDTYLAPV